MRFARLGERGAEIPVVLDGETAYDLRPVSPDIDGNFWTNQGPQRAGSALEAGMLSPCPARSRCAWAPRLRVLELFCASA